ncbi:hypothetical protein F4775DRAFT_590235 [Biscogniauxia sp. FL1348]|nr:hypothetical protein F4775DRAFT_590235 [Biscogniauxia sp. FL1348]
MVRNSERGATSAGRILAQLLPGARFVFLGHGDLDKKKPHVLAEAAARTFRAAGYELTWKLIGWELLD